MLNMRCAICGWEVDAPDKAMPEGWVPYILDGESEQEGPFCASCAEVLFDLDEEGEFILLDRYRGKISFLEGEFEDMDDDEYDIAGIILEYCDN